MRVIIIFSKNMKSDVFSGLFCALLSRVIFRSTSKLRREPGMDKRCYRCGSSEHKTPQCPQDPALKRPNAGVVTGPDQKRLALDPLYVFNKCQAMKISVFLFARTFSKVTGVIRSLLGVHLLMRSFLELLEGHHLILPLLKLT